ncbi:MAG: hypothetical protein ABIH82_03100 [Candidatus Woesearchaeota archaeon]
MVIESKQIVEKLEHIQLDLNFIKKHLSDLDLVMTDDDIDSLKEAEEDLTNGRTTRL